MAEFLRKGISYEIAQTNEVYNVTGSFYVKDNNELDDLSCYITLKTDNTPVANFSFTIRDTRNYLSFGFENGFLDRKAEMFNLANGIISQIQNEIINK